MKIARKISFSFFAVALILASASATIFYSIAKDGLRKSIDNNLATECCFRSDNIKTYLKMLEVSVGQLSKSVVLENFLIINSKEDPQQSEEAFKQALRRLKNTKEANSAIAEFLLMDKTGKVVVSSNESSIGVDKSADSYFLGGQEEIYIKDVYYSETYKEPLMAASAPILNSQTGELLGVLAARVRLNDLNNIIVSEIGMGKTGEIYVVNKHGFMITPSRFREGAVLKQKVDTLNTKQALLDKGVEHLLSQDQDKMAEVFPDYRGVQVLGAHEYLPQMDWMVLAEIDAKEALAPLAKLRLVFILIVFIVPFSAWLLGIFISGLIIGPLHKLHKGTEVIGSGNLDYKVGTSAKDEVGQLSRAFDDMAGHLKKTTTSIENLNREVAERKRVEKALSENEERFRQLFESSRDAIMTLDRGGFIDCNNQTLELFGIAEKADFIKKIPSVFSPLLQPDGSDSLSASNKHIEQAFKEGTNFFEWVHKRQDGSTFPAEVLLSRFQLQEEVYLQATVRDITERRRIEEEKKRILIQQQGINILQQALIAPSVLENKLKTITDNIVRIFNVDFCRIWVIQPGDLCTKGCIHAAVKEGPHVCRFRDKCLHLFASSGRYTHINGGHHRVPFDCYKIGRVASGKEHKFLTNDVTNDPRVHNHDWARELGLVSFAGYQLKVPSGETIGVLALFAKHPILPTEDALLDNLSSATAFIIQQATAEEKIKDANREWFDTFNSISDFVFILNKESVITKVNKAFLDALQLKEENVLGKKCYEIVHKSCASWPNCPHQKTIVDNESHTEIVEDPGLGLPLMVTTSPILNDKGELLGSVHIAKDITQIKKAENELLAAKKGLEEKAWGLAKANEMMKVLYKEVEQKNKELIRLEELKTNFLSTISHELRTPLTAIKEGISIVLDGASGAINNEQQEFLGIAKRNVDRLGRLINDVLDFQKLESGKTVFNIQPNDINAVAKEVSETMLSVAERKGLELKLDFEQNLPQVQFDRDKIIQVLTNLVNNAIKFTEKGSICVQISREDNFIKVSVKDSGIGIKDEDMPRMFTRFEQLDTGMTRKTGGTGLGLSISKEIIEKHNGKIWAESEFGKGTAFHFILPIKERRG
jgi:PAS domain S-box-containing protein